MSPLHRGRTVESIVSPFSSRRSSSPPPVRTSRVSALFNGKDLTGWRVGNTELAGKTASDDGRFAVKDGVLVITGSKDKPPKIDRDRHGGIV